MNSSPVSCTSCHQESTTDGKIIWVCDNCLAINQPLVTPPAASSPPPVTPDVTEAQAAINAAAAEAEKSVLK